MSEKVTSNAHARAREVKPRVTYSDALLSEMLDRIASGESLNAICSTADMPSRKAFLEWVGGDASIKTRYEMAMLLRADKLAEEIIEIADEASEDSWIDDDGRVRTDHEVVARSRLRVDARKWYASKLAPKKYGDKVAAEVTGANGGPIETKELSANEAARRIAFALTKGLMGVTGSSQDNP